MNNLNQLVKTLCLISSILLLVVPVIVSIVIRLRTQEKFEKRIVSQAQKGIYKKWNNPIIRRRLRILISMALCLILGIVGWFGISIIQPTIAFSNMGVGFFSLCILLLVIIGALLMKTAITD